MQIETPAIFNPDDIARLYLEFRPLVRKLIRLYGYGAVDPRDLSQEIYLMFRGLLDRYDPNRGIPLRPYMVRNLTASTYTYIRSQGRKKRREVSYYDLIGGEDNFNLGDAGGLIDWWDNQIIIDQLLRKLPDAIGRLPPRQRYVLIEHYYRSVSFNDLATRLRIKPSSVRSLSRNALNNLRLTLRKEVAEIGDDR